MVAERSYGEYIDTILHQAPSGALTPHYGNDALTNLLSMQRLGRLQVVLGYWPEIRYQAKQAQIAEDELEFYPIQGTGKYLSGYVACSDTTQGRQAISEINQLLRTLPHEHLNQLYAAWLDPERASRLSATGPPVFRTTGRAVGKRRTKETPRSGETTRG